MADHPMSIVDQLRAEASVWNVNHGRPRLARLLLEAASALSRPTVGREEIEAEIYKHVGSKAHPWDTYREGPLLGVDRAADAILALFPSTDLPMQGGGWRIPGEPLVAMSGNDVTLAFDTYEDAAVAFERLTEAAAPSLPGQEGGER